MKIGELVSRTGVSKQLIHHYLREGLLAKPKKTGINSATYDESHVQQIELIKNLRDKYFLPLPMIKKIVKRQKKLSQAEKTLFEIQSSHLAPIDRFFPHDVKGEEEFREATGLGRFWLKKMQEWRIITPRDEDGEPVYSQTDIEMGRLILTMDLLGAGPKNGHNPEFLRHMGDMIRETLASSTREYMAKNIDKLGTEEFRMIGQCYSEALSLFIYLLFKKIMTEEAEHFVENLAKDRQS
ncbi:MAG: MerR family transcriptional regulator [Desulfatibacillum sp.]|nr:MerR family transcriptional regulator [Desulfatibacillum sp.]